jgi:hypothetical protein
MDKTIKLKGAKAFLDKIRSLVKKHRDDVADKMNVDEPAVPRRDDQGNDITDKPKHHKTHYARRSTRRQFMKVHSEELDDTQKEPGEGSDNKGLKAKTPKAKAKDVKNDGSKPTSANIVLNPDEEEYDNNPLFVPGRNEVKAGQGSINADVDAYAKWISDNKNKMEY